jgi:hypothetical protein
MKSIHVTAFVLTLGAASCAHAPQPYTFTAQRAPDDIDVVVRTLEANGLVPASIERASGTVTTRWFDTGYRFREIDDFRDSDYETNIYLRYHVTLLRDGDKDTVMLHADVQRCSPDDSYVIPAGVVGSCQPMSIVFPTQQKQVDALGDRLRLALASRRAVRTALRGPQDGAGQDPLPALGTTRVVSSSDAPPPLR